MAVQHTVDDNPAHTIKDALEDVRLAEWNLMQYRTANARVINTYEHLRDATREAKDDLARAIAEAGISHIDDPAGEFHITFTQQDRGYYDVESLPAVIRDNPAITRLVTDRDRIERAVKTGWLSREQAEAAWVPKPTKPSVRVRPVIQENER